MSKVGLTNLCILVILVAWSGSVAIGWYDHTQRVPVTVELAMGSVLGYLFGSKFLGKTEGQQMDAPPPPPKKAKQKRWYERQ